LPKIPINMAKRMTRKPVSTASSQYVTNWATHVIAYPTTVSRHPHRSAHPSSAGRRLHAARTQPRTATTARR
jgi:hypothetical protein